MVETLALVLAGASLLGLLVAALQVALVARHLVPRQPGAHDRRETGTAGISILKPLCGVDDDLAANLASFAALDHPRFEVLLGVRGRHDGAYPLALEAAARWPERFRVVLQQGEPGLNPKVNQLLTLERAARFPVVVISDSNVRVRPDYLATIDRALADPGVGLVTHPICGVGARSLGAALDNLQLATGVATGVVAAARLVGHGIVVGKSMALRREDLRRLGGFESVKDVLAEDYVLGLMVARQLGLRIAVAPATIENVARHWRVADFAARYRRWSLIQRQVAGRAAHAAQLLLNPLPLALAAALLVPSAAALGGAAAVLGTKLAIDALAVAALRPSEFGWRWIAAAPLKDLVMLACWAHGQIARHVVWRGNRLRVLAGTRLAAPSDAAAAGPAADGFGTRATDTFAAPTVAPH